MKRFLWLFLLPIIAYGSAILPPPGGNPTIGGSVIGGDDESVLFVNPAGTLAEDTGVFTYDAGSGLLSTPDLQLSNLTTGVCHVDINGNITSSLIVNADVDASADIDRSKLASGTANRVVINGSGGVMTEDAQLTYDSTTNVLGASELSTGTIQANGSGGLVIESSGSNTIATLGAGPGTQAVFAGSVEVEGSFSLEDTGAGTNRITINPPSPLSSDYTITLPLDGGTNGYVTTTDGSGVLSFTDPTTLESNTDLEEAYNNGSDGEIILTSGIGGIRIEDAATPVGVDLFTVADNGATTDYLNVTDSVVSVNSLQVDDLNPGRVPYVTTGGQITDTALFSFDGIVLSSQTMSTDDLDALTSSGLSLENDTGGDIALFGESGGTSSRFYGTTLFESSARFVETGGGTDSINLIAPGAVTATDTLTLPDGDGEAGQALYDSDGNGAMAWQNPFSVSGSKASPNVIVAATGIAAPSDRRNHRVYVSGNSGDINITANPQIANGLWDGQEICVIGTSNIDTVTLDDGDGLSLDGQAVLGEDDMLCLWWNATDWIEKGIF